MSHEYAALLKAHRDIPVLSTAINNTVTQESTFPTKEHPSLLTHTGKTINTPLNSALSARHIKVKNLRRIMPDGLQLVFGLLNGSTLL